MAKNTTLDYYNKNANMYFKRTVDANMQENYDWFLKRIPYGGYILDFGCGSGRDSKYFIENGYKIKAIDGSTEMCKLASNYIGQSVDCMMFDELNDIEIYDGIWACSSILHVDKEELPIILEKMIIALKESGVIFTAFKKGNGYEIKDGKYYNHITREELEVILSNLKINGEIIDYFENGSVLKNVDDIWCKYIIKKKGIKKVRKLNY